MVPFKGTPRETAGRPRRVSLGLLVCRSAAWRLGFSHHAAAFGPGDAAEGGAAMGPMTDRIHEKMYG